MSEKELGIDGYRLAPYNFCRLGNEPLCWAYEDHAGLLIYNPSGHIGTLSWATLEAMQRRHIVAKARRKYRKLDVGRRRDA